MTLNDKQKKPSAQGIVDPQHLQYLRAHLQGHVFVPGDDGYNKARLSWDTFHPDSQHPALVVLPASATDVSVAVTFAREHNLPIAVQGGGHGHLVPAHAYDVLLINFAQMKAIHIDPEAAIARIEPGVRAGDLVQAAHPFGLAFPNGWAATVGVTGYLLGGGTGWFARQYGPGASSIRSMEVVTVDGRVLHVNQTSHPDLFWGMRGGDGNFGIVTSLELNLYPVKEVFGGQVIYPIAAGKQVISAYLEWVRAVPDELTSAFRIMHFPPLPELPEMLRGQSVIILMACYNGETSIGEALLQPIRTITTPLLDTMAPLPYSQIATISNDPTEIPPFEVHTTTAAFQEILPSDIDAILAIASGPASGLFVVDVRHLGGGAFAKLSEETMAFHFSSNFFLYLVAAGPAVENLEVGKRSLNAIMQALQPRLSGEILMNFLEFNDISIERTRAAFPPASYKRLVALKDQYDPENVFHFNHNIPPSSQPGSAMK